jgi:prolyl oligopeptidase
MMTIAPRYCLTAVLAACGFAIAASTMPRTQAAPPATRTEPVTDTFHGVDVTEHYRWLEDAANPEVQAWSDAENAYARAILDKLPGVAAIRARVAEIMSAETTSYWGVQARGDATAGWRYFAWKEQPPKQQPFLVVTDSLDDLASERTLVDPNAIDATGGTSMTWFRPSADGALVAVCLSQGGDEVGDVSVFDAKTGEQVDIVIPRVNTGTAGGDLAWAPDGRGFYYTRHPRDGERPAEDMNFYQQVFYHELGTPTAADRYELGKDSPRIAETELKVDRRTGRVLATIQNGDGGEFAHYLRDPDGKWRQFSKFEEKVIQAEFGPDEDLYVVTRKNAPNGKIARVSVDTLDVDNGALVVPETDNAIVTSFWHDNTVLVTGSRLYLVSQRGGPSVIEVYDLEGKPQPAPEQLPVASVGALVPLVGEDILFEMGSYVKPPAVYRHDAASAKTTPTALKTIEPVNLDDAEVVREFATSKDGTRAPVNILYRKGTLKNGTNPCLVTAYGGYGVNIPPGFRALNRVLLDHGFVIATANIRGGGEYGEAWHRGGNLTNKQNVFDDFAAVLQHLVDEHYTSPEKLAIIGGSNGGLLMGATLTQHPDLMKAVVSSVGIYDMLRVELSPNGAFNVTEFGTVKEADHFHAMHAYSPYHNVRNGVKYPAVLFLTGANDPRVDPMQSRKMTARLQAADPSGEFLLRTSADSGHGLDTPLTERIAQQTDIFAFVFDQLGVPFH